MDELLQWSVAVLTTWCQTSLSLAFLQAVWTPKVIMNLARRNLNKLIVVTRRRDLNVQTD